MQAESFNSSTWNQIIGSLPGSHLLQTWEWAQVKAKYGWQVHPFVWRPDAGRPPVAAVMLLQRTIAAGGFAKKMCILYAPKGPLLDWENASLRENVLNDLQAYARQQGAIFIKIDPDVIIGTGIPGSDGEAFHPVGTGLIQSIEQQGWNYSPDQIQFKNSVLINLQGSEDEILARMKQKSRYNIRLAEKKGVTIRVGTAADLPKLYQLYAETSIRDGFVIRDEGYYQAVWTTFLVGKNPRCEALLAEVEGETVAAIFMFIFGARAYYLYGMSRQAHRDKMPNHLLQWEAIRRAKAVNCQVYDLWGAPDVFDESDGMWGVFRFKEGLGGQVVRTIGAWDFTPSPLLYRMYTRVIPRLLDIMRSRGKQQTKQSLE